MNENKERRRRHTFPVRRQQSYDHNLYLRELYKSYILPATAEPNEPTTQTEQVSVPESTQTTIERHYIGESYSYTSRVNPDLRPYKSAPTNSSANRLPRPQSRDDHNRSRSISPFCRNVGKEVTDNFLFSDNISTNFNDDK